MTGSERRTTSSQPADRVAAIRQALGSVIDPEMGASLVDLNMVRRVDVIGDLAQIDLVLTTPGCPLAYWLMEQARRAAQTVPGIADAVVRVVDEPWERPGWEDWLARTLGDRR